MKIGVIGTGSMGENHVRTYAALTNDCQLVGVYDNDETKAREIAKKYQVKEFATLPELLQAVDAVSIAVPTKYHYEIGLACIRHKVHMLIEKPIAHTVSQAKQLIEKATEEDVIIQIGHIELFNPVIHTLKTILAEEKILAVDVHRMNPYDPRVLKVDVVQDLMIHDLYILRELLQDEIDGFYAMGKVINGTLKHAVVVSKYGNGVIAQLTASFKSEEPIRSIRVITEKGLVKANLLTNTIEIIRTVEYYGKIPSRQYPQRMTETIHLSHNEPLKNELIDFIDCIKHNRKPTVTGEDGMKAIKVTNDIRNFIKRHSS